MNESAPIRNGPVRVPLLPLFAGIPCAAVPLFLCVTGYGAYLRISWFVVLPALIGSAFLVLYLIRALRNLAMGEFNASLRSKQDTWLALSFAGMSILSWIAGTQLRRLHCESICVRAEPAIQALQKYHAVHGSYPARLEDVPEFRWLARAGNVAIQQGRIGRGGLDVGPIEQADMTIYLERSGYLCVVPLERKLIMSITRFYVLRKDNESARWSKDHLIWTLTGL